MSVSVTLVTEDILSLAAAKKILQHYGEWDLVDGITWNKQKVRGRISGINKAAVGAVYFVLTDQDTLDNCPPNALREIPEAINPNLIYRFAVMEIEAWLLADRKGIADFLNIPLNKIPSDSQGISTPKEFLIDLAKRSRSKRIREDIAPRPPTLAKTGKDYNGRLIEFVINHWDINRAAQCSDSLRRALNRIGNFTPVT